MNSGTDTTANPHADGLRCPQRPIDDPRPWCADCEARALAADLDRYAPHGDKMQCAGPCAVCDGRYGAERLG